MKTFEEILEIIQKGTAEIISIHALHDKLKKSMESGIPLKIKLGLDPSSPDIHLGHTVVLQKLRDFQQLGHTIQLVIGDFTGMIGDPTGKNKTRPALSREQVLENAKTYKEQIFKILDPEKTEVHFNSSWLSQLNFEDVLKLAGNVTLSQMLSRNDFSNRFENQQPISLHEFFYPLMQGYDSVALESDIEIGGTDQTFNLMMGKDLQKACNQETQVAITMPILEGLDGVEKMSKSLGNYIGVLDSPNDMFGKTMSIPDELIIKYFTLLTDKSSSELLELKKEMKEKNPRDAKMKLAYELVVRFHSEEDAVNAKEHFITKFQKNAIPNDIDCVSIHFPSMNIIDLLVYLEFVSSKSEARRKISEGAVRINTNKIMDMEYEVSLEDGTVVQLGKKKMIKIKK